jgi:hypothetical protein
MENINKQSTVNPSAVVAVQDSEVLNNKVYVKVQEVVPPSVPVSVVPPVSMSDDILKALLEQNAQNAELLKIQRQRENAALQVAEEKAKSQERITKQRRDSAKVDVNSTRNLQAVCNHLKDRGNPNQTGKIDHNVYMHTFVNGSKVIKCHSCRMKWRPKDTKEFLYRGEDDKREIPNHTHLSWSDAYRMSIQSTNKSSSSNRPLGGQEAPLDSLGNPVVTAEIPTFEYEI